MFDETKMGLIVKIN